MSEDNVIPFKLAPKTVMVHPCMQCGGLVFYLEVCPDAVIRPRCYDCSCLAACAVTPYEEEDEDD